MTPPVATQSVTRTLSRRAFSLIELLVVITIIAVVIAITVPALSGARELARKSATQGTINSLVQGAGQFSADNSRAPGYFSQDEMGDPENINRGFSSMQNIMLDLVGGPVESSSAAGLLQVGPSSSAEVDVDPALINVGDNSKGYYTPNGKEYKAVVGKNASNADHRDLPDVIDAWCMPILAWVQNDIGSVMNDNSMISDFAQISTGASPDPARYYWAQNSAALGATALGQRQIDQNTQSLIGGSVMDADRVNHLTALLGSPSSSVKSDRTYSAILPRVGRGSIVFQSAGADRIYLSSKDKGYGSVGGEFLFGRNLTPNANVNAGQYPRKDGTQGSIDIVEGFDDVVNASGN